MTMASRRADPFIMPHERRVVTVRQHPIIFMWKPALTTMLTLAGACWLTIVYPGGWVIIWLFWLATAANFVRAFLTWMMTYLVVTNMRIVMITGLLTRRVSTMPIVKVVDMSFERPFWGQVFNYGRLVLESAAPGHPLHRIENIPRPDETYMTICSLLFSVPEGHGTGG